MSMILRRPLAGRTPFGRLVPTLALLLVAGLAAAPGATAPAAAAPGSAGSFNLFFDPPLDGATVSYHAVIGWVALGGGTIDHYEYAVDPPETVWVSTTETSHAFTFSTPDPDSTQVGSQLIPAGTYSGMHTLVLRAVDDQGEVSATAQATFTALDQTPVSQIVYPEASSWILNVGVAQRVSWAGYDPDGPAPPAFEYKLVNLDDLYPSPSLTSVQPGVLYAAPGPWIRQGADTLDHVFALVPGGRYVFGVRAVDGNGAVEPFLEFGRNAQKLQAFEGGGHPSLAVRVSQLGSYAFGTDGVDSLALSLPAGGSLEVEVGCSGEVYGGICESMRWGVDLPDTADGNPSWSAWGPVGSLPPQTVAEGIHTLTLQVRDTMGATTTGVLVLTGVRFAFDRDVLWVDDAVNGAWPEPTDAQVDAFWSSLLADNPVLGGDWNTSSKVDRFETFGANDIQFTPSVPTLETLGHYKLVIWECNGTGSVGQTGLFRAATQMPLLRAYLAGGGGLWIDGSTTVPPMLVTGGAYPDFTYPKAPAPGDFAYDAMKLLSTRIENPKGSNRNANLVGTELLPGASGPYPALPTDPAKLNPFQGGIPFWEAIFDPIAWPAGTPGVLDSLYRSVTQSAASSYAHRLCAVRWHDPGMTPSQGRVQWFGFPLYYMQQAQAQATFDRSLDWFREDDLWVPVRLSHLEVAREGEGAVLRWGVAEATNHAGFRVYRAAPGGERQLLTPDLLSGRTEYVFTDPAAPRTETEYWLEELSRSGESAWLGPVTLASAGPFKPILALSSIFPNPFRASAEIRYVLPERGPVAITVYDVRGREVARVLEATQEPGSHLAAWNGRSEAGREAPAGLYFVRLQAGDRSLVRKVLRTR